MEFVMTNPASPLYARVYAAIKQAIQDGRLPPGEPLPSEKELEAEHGVSRITVRRALEELERDHLILRGRGRQARVADLLVSVARTEIEDDVASLLTLVRGTEAKLLRFAWQFPDEAVRGQLEVPAGEPILLVERLRSLNGTPIMLTLVHVPARIGAKLDQATVSKRTMLEQLRDQGVTIAHAVQEMRAAPCPESIAPLLDLKSGEPIFVFERLVRDDEGRPIQHLVASLRWDSYSYRITSTRSATGRVVEMAGAGRVAAPLRGAQGGDDSEGGSGDEANAQV